MVSSDRTSQLRTPHVLHLCVLWTSTWVLEWFLRVLRTSTWVLERSLRVLRTSTQVLERPGKTNTQVLERC